MPREAPRPSTHFGWDHWRGDDCRGPRLGTPAAGFEGVASAPPPRLLIRLSGYSSRFALTPPAEVLGWHGRICLPYGRERVESGPRLYAVPATVGAAMEDRLRRHYGLRSLADDSMTVRRTV